MGTAHVRWSRWLKTPLQPPGAELLEDGMGSQALSRSQARCSSQVRGTAENALKYFDYKNGIFLLNVFGNTIANPCIPQVGDAEKLFLPFPQPP